MALDALRSAIFGGVDTQPPPDESVAGAVEAGAARDVEAGAGADAETDTDWTLAPCPACARPIPRWSLRCEGCGLRLVLEVPLRKAAPLIGGGMMAGLLVGVLLVGLLGIVQPASTPATTAANARDGSASGQAGADGGRVPVVEIPSGSAAALRAATQINGRLATAAGPLAAAFAAKPFSAGDVAKLLRGMKVDVRSGSVLPPLLEGWEPATAYRADLDRFYERLTTQIDTGLSASVRSAGAYKKAAKRVLETLRDLVSLDAAGRTLATTAGLELAPISIPKAIGG